MMAILCCGALAFAVTGCRYDDPNADDLANSQDVASEVPADDAMNAGKDIDTEGADANAANAANANADETSLSNVTGLPFDQDPNYARCTDVALTRPSWRRPNWPRSRRLPSTCRRSPSAS